MSRPSVTVDLDGWILSLVRHRDEVTLPTMLLKLSTAGLTLDLVLHRSAVQDLKRFLEENA